MGAALQDAHRKVLRRETVMGIAVNAIIPPAIIAALGVPPPQEVAGPQGVLPGLVMASAAATFLMTLIVTTVIRAGVRRGAVPALAWPPGERGLLRLVPRQLLLRALLMGLAAALVLVPAGLLIVVGAGLLPMSVASAHVFNVGFGALVGAAVSRQIVLLAMAD